jgi:CubicO group peptidase (beta-lactamase class C family)
VTENTPIPITLRDWALGYFEPGGKYYSATQNFDTGAPATAFSYSNSGVALSGYAVEKLTGAAFDDYCKAHIFEPLGMHESSFRLAGLDPSHIAMEYDSDGVTELGNDDYPDFPDGELRTSVSQFARFLLAYMNDGALGGARILEEATVAEMRRPQMTALASGQGIIWYYEKHVGRDIFGHQGILPGVSTVMGYDPAAKIGAIVFSNGSAFNDDVPAKVDAIYAVFHRLLEEAATLSAHAP